MQPTTPEKFFNDLFGPSWKTMLIDNAKAYVAGDTYFIEHYNVVDFIDLYPEVVKQTVESIGKEYAKNTVLENDVFYMSFLYYLAESSLDLCEFEQFLIGALNNKIYPDLLKILCLCTSNKSLNYNLIKDTILFNFHMKDEIVGDIESDIDAKFFAMAFQLRDLRSFNKEVCVEYFNRVQDIYGNKYDDKLFLNYKLLHRLSALYNREERSLVARYMQHNCPFGDVTLRLQNYILQQYPHITSYEMDKKYISRPNNGRKATPRLIVYYTPIESMKCFLLNEPDAIQIQRGVYVEPKFIPHCVRILNARLRMLQDEDDGQYWNLQLLMNCLETYPHVGNAADIVKKLFLQTWSKYNNVLYIPKIHYTIALVEIFWRTGVTCKENNIVFKLLNAVLSNDAYVFSMLYDTLSSFCDEIKKLYKLDDEETISYVTNSFVYLFLFAAMRMTVDTEIIDELLETKCFISLEPIVPENMRLTPMAEYALTKMIDLGYEISRKNFPRQWFSDEYMKKLLDSRIDDGVVDCKFILPYYNYDVDVKSLEDDHVFNEDFEVFELFVNGYYGADHPVVERIMRLKCWKYVAVVLAYFMGLLFMLGSPFGLVFVMMREYFLYKVYYRGVYLESKMNLFEICMTLVPVLLLIGHLDVLYYIHLCVVFMALMRTNALFMYMTGGTFGLFTLVSIVLNITLAHDPLMLLALFCMWYANFYSYTTYDCIEMYVKFAKELRIFFALGE